MSGYLPIEDGPITVREAIDRYGAAAVPLDAMAEPTYYVATHAAVDGSYVLVALNPRYFRERTNWRIVREDGSRHAKIMYRCPQDGALIDHIYEHWSEDGGHKRGVA